MKHDHIKLILIKGAFPLVVSVAGIALSILMARRSRRDKDHCPVDLQEEEQSRPLCPTQSSNDSESTPSCSERSCAQVEMEDFENRYCPRQKITGLLNHLNVLQDMEQELEARVLRYISMKDHEYALKEGQNALELEVAQVDALVLKVEFMEAECRRLAEYLSVVSQLEAARSEVEILKRKTRKLGRANRRGLRALHQQAAGLRLLEAKRTEEKQGLEDTIVGLLQKINLLESEKRELMETLELQETSTQSIAQSREDGGREEPCKTVDDEKLLSQIEQPQNDRLTNLEELIHLRWANACLRYELWRTQEQQKSPEQEATRRPPITQFEEHESRGAYDTTGYDSESSSPATGTGDGTAMEVAGGRHPGSTKPILFQRLKKWVKKEGCKRAAAVSDVEDHCKCAGRQSLDDAAMADPARNSC
ncbi:protein CHUP1, chloroplastic-like [Aristolochia californica]|uniref:protein CHUP1, chloroplastic-like n=1 Tax=Aristolochia californica TaxID=171875 RepID=UPI0035E1AD5C